MQEVAEPSIRRRAICHLEKVNQKHFWDWGSKSISSENRNVNQKEISGEAAKTSTLKKSIEEKIIK
jgi:hypothetical protein